MMRQNMQRLRHLQATLNPKPEALNPKPSVDFGAKFSS